MDIISSDLSQESIDLIKSTQKNFSVTNFFRSCRCLNPLLDPSLPKFKDYLHSVILKYLNQNCIYIELRDYPRCNTEEEITSYLKHFYLILKEINSTYENRALIRLVIGVNKNKKCHDQNLLILDLMKKMPSDYKKYITGVDLCGEHSLSFKDFSNYKYIINEFKSCGYKTTIHFYEDEVLYIKF